MPSDIALQITSQYQSNGIDQATAGVKKFTDQVDQGGQKSTQSMEGLFKRLERPVGMIAFSGVAEQLTGMSEKGATAGLMVERGLHAAGAALMYFNPLLGMAVIAGTALFEVFERIAGESELTKEGLEKLFQTNEQLAQSFKDAAKEALKEGARKDVIESLKQQAQALENVTTHTKDRAKAEMDAARAQLQAVLTGKDAQGQLEIQSKGHLDEAEKLRRVKKAQDEYNKSIQTYTAVLADNAAKRPGVEDKNYLNDIAVAKEKLGAKTESLMQIEAREAQLKGQIAELEQQLADSTTKAEVEAVNKKIEALNRLVQVNQQAADAILAAQKKQEKGAQETGDFVKGTFEDITKAMVDNGGKQHNIAEEIGKDMLKTTVKYLVQKLQAQAVADLANPLTVPVGIAEMAAAGVLEGLAGGIGSGGGSATPSASTGQNAIQTPSAQGNTGNQTHLSVYVQGGVMNDNFAANLAKRLSDVVQFNNVQLFASNGSPNVAYSH